MVKTLGMNNQNPFTEPDGFVWGDFKNAQGAKIRYGHVLPKGDVKGTVVIVGGFKEPIEKYHEVTQDMLSRGYAVWLMDWRGQGGSDKYLPGTQRAHSEGYEEQIDSLHQFITQVIGNVKEPLHLLAHSMGAHIGLRYMKEHPQAFDSAILSAPMMDINTAPLPRAMARLMAKGAVAGKYEDKYIPGGSDWDENKEDVLTTPLTSDPVRYEASKKLFKDSDTLRLGDPTYGWVYHTFKSIDILNDKDFLKAIETPILMEISGNEKVVIRSASERAAKLLPNCKRIDIEGARHEIWMERDSLRSAWLKVVDGFMAERLALHGKAKPKNNPPAP